MACLPNCGVLDLTTSIRPRIIAQDAIVHSLQLAPAAQHTFPCHAGVSAYGPTHEVSAIYCPATVHSVPFNVCSRWFCICCIIRHASRCLCACFLVLPLVR